MSFIACFYNTAVPTNELVTVMTNAPINTYFVFCTYLSLVIPPYFYFSWFFSLIMYHIIFTLFNLFLSFPSHWISVHRNSERWTLMWWYAASSCDPTVICQHKNQQLELSPCHLLTVRPRTLPLSRANPPSRKTLRGWYSYSKSLFLMREA